MNQEITYFIESLQEVWQIELCNELRQIVNRCIPDVEERIQYKKPHFLKNGKYAAVITPSKEAISFTIFNASELELPEGMFDGPPERKTIKFRKGQPVDSELLSQLLTQSASSL